MYGGRCCMDTVLELLLDLFLEGGMEVSKSKQVPKYIRYPVMALVIAILAACIGLILVIGIAMLRDSVLAGLLLIALAGLAAFFGIRRFRRP